MTFRADEIQKLIADIDNLLASSGKRLPKLLSNQSQEEPKEILERVRSFLVQLRDHQASEIESQNKLVAQPQMSPLLAKFVDQNHPSTSSPNQPDQEQSNFLSQQLKSELSVLIQPLQAEIAALSQERTNLVQEIRQLEQRRLHNYSLSQQLENQEQMIAEFLQVLMSRIVTNIAPHLNNNSSNLLNINSESHENSLEVAPSASPPFVEASEPLERLTNLAKDLDQRLLSLDGTVNVVFEALRRNINTYHDSLSQALARMHSTGIQGEQLMANFVNNLTQYLSQQSFSPQLSALEIDNQVLPPSLSSQENTVSPANIEPAKTISQAPAASSTNPINSTEDIEITEDLDAVLLELGVDLSISSDTSNIPSELQSNSISSIGDEVDRLYANLFGSSVLNNTNSETNSELARQDLLDLDIADITPTSPTEIVQPEVTQEVVTENLSDSQIAEPESLTDSTPLLEESDTVLNIEATQAVPTPPADSALESEPILFVAEDTNPPSTDVDVSSLSLAVPEFADGFPVQPTSEDTVTNLTDILPDAIIEEPFFEVSSAVEAQPVTPIETIVNEQPQEVMDAQQQEQLLDDYVPASPQENLLLPEEIDAANVPDIVLDEEQWQQLNQDLAKFDELFDTELLSVSDLESIEDEVSPTLESFSSPETLEESSAVAFSGTEISQAAPISLPQTEVDLDFTPTTEKKKEPTTSQSDSSLVSSSIAINDTEVLPSIIDAVWYLGIDLGTTGISAALLNRTTGIVYPIYWSTDTEGEDNSFQQSFRLPAEVYLPSASVPHGENERRESQEQTPAASVAQDTTAGSSSVSQNNLYSAQLKPYLQVAIAYKSERQKWEPVLQFNEFSAGPLIWVVRSLSKLLLTLKSDRQSTTQGLVAAASGLNPQTFNSIINQISGVICTCPSNSNEQYRFNVREAILTSKLVEHPQQVLFVEEAIASLLSLLDDAQQETRQHSDQQGLPPTKISEPPLIGNTLVINIGASATEMALVDLPENLLQLAHNDFMLHGFAYASKGIEQDIICQLLFPPKYKQFRLENQENSQTTTSDTWQWQPSFSGLDQMQWQSLGLETLDLPRAGEPDMIKRIRLQQRLESSLLGQAVLDAALALKLILQHQESFTLELADQRWVLHRRDLETLVFVPFVRRLNRELNKLLVARGIPTEAINQAILTGGVASLGVVNSWLRQKLPNARIIQDLYLGENGAPNCSRVAYGLAMLPLHPQVLEQPRQQYTDYFLFTELLRLLPETSLSFSEILQLFEDRGIDTSICQQRIMAFLEGELPPGLIPAGVDSTWLTQSSQENADYQAIASLKLFEKQGNLTYRANTQQQMVLHRYLDAIKASTQQSLEEPNKVNFVLQATQ